MEKGLEHAEMCGTRPALGELEDSGILHQLRGNFAFISAMLQLAWAMGSYRAHDLGM